MTLGANNGEIQEFDGAISNFKLYDVALTAEEVAMEYALGRTGKSLNLTDTALCLGGTVPRAQLDVRGSMIVNGIIKHAMWPAFRVTPTVSKSIWSNTVGATNEKSSGHNGDVNDYNEVLAFDNIQYDNTGSYSTGTSNYKFTAPISGFYSFHFHCLFSRSSTSSSRLDLKYHKNGGLINHLEMAGDFSTSSAFNVGRGHTCHVHLSAGDYIQAVFVGVGDRWTVYTSGGYATFDVFSGHLVFADM
jgi:hypothetical protein